MQSSSTETKNVRNLLGSPTVSGWKLKDEQGLPGVFFVFPDLAVRAEGMYTLKFTLSDMASRIEGQSTLAAPPLASVFSLCFKVYSPRTFPGMSSSSPLIQCFRKQGLKILGHKVKSRAAKSEADGGTQSTGSTGYDPDEDEDAEGDVDDGSSQ